MLLLVLSFGVDFGFFGPVFERFVSLTHVLTKLGIRILRLGIFQNLGFATKVELKQKFRI